MELCDSNKRRIAIGRKIGDGGEATIYQVLGRTSDVAKIYTKPMSWQQQWKLKHMVQYPPYDKPWVTQNHRSIAWPTDLLFDKNGNFRGFIMPYIGNAVPIHEVFNPVARQNLTWGDKITPQFLYVVATNIAIALDAIHKKDYVVGDLNSSNVLVNQLAGITIVDADSFQVIDKHGNKHLCEVGRPEYTPPELQGASLRGTARSPEHDRFGLGVLIFQLLRNGNHPFRGKWVGAGDPPAQEIKIKNGWFPYSTLSSCPVKPPINHSSLNDLSPPIVRLIYSCFVSGHHSPGLRPSASQWAQALSQAEKSLTPLNQLQSILSAIVFADNPEPRCPVVLALDTSESMQGPRIRSLNKALLEFSLTLKSDPLAAKRVEVAIVTFGSKVQVMDKNGTFSTKFDAASVFALASDFDPKPLMAGGTTPMSNAVIQSLNLLSERKKIYKEKDLDYFRPWLILITDGEPTDSDGKPTKDWKTAAILTNISESFGGVVFYGIGVTGADMSVLREFSSQNTAYHLNGLDFSALFKWLSSSLSVASQTGKLPTHGPG